MQTRNRILDDLGQMMQSAMGVAQGAKDEAEATMRGWMDRWLADRNMVTAEEHEAVKAMAEKALKEVAALKKRIDALEGKPAARPKAARKPAAKPKPGA